MIEAYVHVEARLRDGSVEQRIYELDLNIKEPYWGLGYTVVNGNGSEAKAIAKLMNDQFNIEINNWNGANKC